MSYESIMKIAQAVADKIGIEIKNSMPVKRNLRGSIPTILSNKDYTLWIDKHYVAYGHNFKPEIIYVFADHIHVREELQSVCSRMKIEKSSYMLKTLKRVREQLRVAVNTMSKNDSEVYYFELEDD